MVVPVPKTTSRVGGLGVVGGREDTNSFFKIVSFEAGSTSSVISMRFALIRNGDADIFSVEDPLVGTFQAFLVVPVPDSASKISWVGSVGW